MSYETKRIYILVKTYPTISKQYSELVCTAGILETGEWIRLYPIPFRKLEIDQKYPKYSWIEAKVQRNSKDSRPESFRPDIDAIHIIEPRPKKGEGDSRGEIIFKSTRVFTSIKELTDKSDRKTRSLAIFKPTDLLDLKVEAVARDWDPDKLAILKGLAQQQNLFQSPEEIAEEFKVVPKVPYKFSYVFKDDSGKTSKLMIDVSSS
jgi:hypothetical protein